MLYLHSETNGLELGGGSILFEPSQENCSIWNELIASQEIYHVFKMLKISFRFLITLLLLNLGKSIESCSEKTVIMQKKCISTI